MFAVRVWDEWVCMWTCVCGCLWGSVSMWVNVGVRVCGNIMDVLRKPSDSSWMVGVHACGNVCVRDVMVV